MYWINKWIDIITGKYVFFVVCRLYKNISLVVKKILPKENFATIFGRFVVKNSCRTEEEYPLHQVSKKFVRINRKHNLNWNVDDVKQRVRYRLRIS